MESLLLPIHIGTLFVTAVLILIADHDAFNYMRGKVLTLSKTKVKVLHYLVWLGLLIMIGTGGTMVYPAWQYAIQNTGFMIKMFFVLVLFINAFVINGLSHLATERPFSALTPKERKMLIVSGMVSTIGWLGAIITALIIFS